MTLSLGTVLTAARDRSQWFHRSRVPDAVVARYLSDLQNELIARAVIRDRQYLAQTAVVSIALSAGQNAAGVGQGQPGTVSGDTFRVTTAPTGSAIELGLSSVDGASVLVAESTVTSATATTLTRTSAARTANADANKVLVITQGPGAGQRRDVISNTTDTWTVAAWSVVPDATSLFELVAPTLFSDDTAGAVTALPSTTTNQSYLVKLDASGVPYIDYTTPLTATLEQGVPLPSMHALLPDLCQLWRRGRSEPSPLWVTDARRRHAPMHGCGVYTIGSTLYLTGCSADWTDVASLELRYVPVTSAFTALTDLFLLPDHARPALVAMAAAFMAMRVSGMSEVVIDPTPHAQAAARAEAEYLRTVLLGKRGRTPRVREVW